MAEFSTALFLAVVVKAILDYVAEPMRMKFPNLDLWWFNYVALVFGGAVSWLAQLNLFADFVTVAWLGQLLTAFLVGGGAKLLNDVFSNAPNRVTTTPLREMRGTETVPVVKAKERNKGW